MSDFKISKNGVLTRYLGKEKDVVIPEGVTEIGYAAFYNNYYLKSVQFSSSVTVIGVQAFEDCKNLEEVHFSDGLIRVGNNAFHGCINLKSVTIPEKVTDIGVWAFNGCDNLNYVSLPPNIKHIGGFAFGYGLNFIDNKGFFIVDGYLLHYHGNNSHAVIPDNVTMICDGAFAARKYNDKIEHITIPETVTSIGANAFENCKNLKSARIPDGVTSIESGTFVGCSELVRVDIPDSVTSVKSDAFDLNSKKLQIYIADISILPAKLKGYAAVCFAEDGRDTTDTYSEGYLKYIKANAEKLLDMAILNPSFLRMMCREKLISPKHVTLFKDAVIANGDPELIALILDYGAQKSVAKQVKTAAKRKEQQFENVVERKIARNTLTTIEGLSFVVTGDLETFETRKELKDFIERNGGKLNSTISTKVDYLIANDSKSDSKKYAKATSLGIEIITEYQFNDMANRRFLISEERALTRYVGFEEIVSVREGIICVETDAFFDNPMITEIRFPTSLCLLKSLAIYACPKLKDVFFKSADTKMEVAAINQYTDLTIHAPAGSYAEQYAKENNIPFVAEG